MTHLSDYMYADGVIRHFGLLVFSFFWVWDRDQFAALQWSKLRYFRSNSITLLFYFVSAWCYWITDLLCIQFKYSEGFTFYNVSNDCLPTSKADYSQHHLVLVDISNNVLTAAFTFKTSAMFNLLASFHYAFGGFSKGTFLSSIEFKVYSTYSFMSLGMYPALGWMFSFDPFLTSAVPQIFYGLEMIVCLVLCNKVYKKFSQLIGFNDGAVGKSSEERRRRNLWIMRVLLILLVSTALLMPTLIVLNADLVLEVYSGRGSAHASWHCDNRPYDV